jgi:nitroreductase
LIGHDNRLCANGKLLALHKNAAYETRLALDPGILARPLGAWTATNLDQPIMMTVEEAITGRQSIRAYLDRAVPRDVLERVLLTAGRAPSGSNIQPWRVYAVEGTVKDALCADLTARHSAGDEGKREYNYYPVKWRDPYLARRRQTGWGLYGLLGIGREDKTAMAAQARQNFTFFGAPVGLFFTIDRDMELGSWLDTGMFIQSVMLAARGEGLETCPQAAFCQYHDVIQQRLNIPASQQLICGMAVGYGDPDAKINRFRTERIAVSEFVTWVNP